MGVCLNSRKLWHSSRVLATKLGDLKSCGGDEKVEIIPKIHPYPSVVNSEVATKLLTLEPSA